MEMFHKTKTSLDFLECCELCGGLIKMCTWTSALFLCKKKKEILSNRSNVTWCPIKKMLVYPETTLCSHCRWLAFKIQGLTTVLSHTCSLVWGEPVGWRCWNPISPPPHPPSANIHTHSFICSLFIKKILHIKNNKFYIVSAIFCIYV